jgi:hypothetical protein
MAFLFLDKRNVIIGSVVLAVIFSLGIIIGYYGRQMPDSSGSKGDLILEGIFTFLPILKISNEMCESLKSVNSNFTLAVHSQNSDRPRLTFCLITMYRVSHFKLSYLSNLALLRIWILIFADI